MIFIFYNLKPMKRVLDWDTQLLSKKLSFAPVNVYFIRCIDSSKKWQIRINDWIDLTEFYIAFSRTENQQNPALKNTPVSAKTIRSRIGKIRNHFSEYNQVLLFPRGDKDIENKIGKYITYVNNLHDLDKEDKYYTDDYQCLTNSYKDIIENTVCYAIQYNSLAIFEGPTIKSNIAKVDPFINFLNNLGSTGMNITHFKSPSLFKPVRGLVNSEGKRTAVKDGSMLYYNGLLICKNGDVIETMELEEDRDGVISIAGYYTCWRAPRNTSNYFKETCLIVKDGIVPFFDSNTCLRDFNMGKHIARASAYNGNTLEF
jgi:hypothetical protein